MRSHLTAQQAADALGVSKATLYAYTSRGQLRSEPAPGRPRERRYLREDIQRLKDRHEARRDPAKAAAQGLHWGSPVLESGITLIQDGRLFYRGREATNLARTTTLEQVAALLWGAAPQERLFEQPCPLPARDLAALRARTKDPYTLIQTALPLAAAADPAACDLRPAAVRRAGARILRLMAAAALLPADAATRAALVLCADHELNVSAFTARCVASAGASPYEVVAAALAALKGSKHGGASLRAAALFAETRTPRRARSVIAARLRRGEPVPGFGHPLYPKGDPRAAVLLDLVQSPLAASLQRAGSELLGEYPNLDFALAAMAEAHDLPDYAPLLIFAQGRTAGWIAHAMEQYALDQLIRPRARYTGPAPEAA